MRYSKGIYFCHTPIVDPENHYDCEHFISIEQFPENCPVEKLHKFTKTGIEEWNNCIEILTIPTGGVDSLGYDRTERSATLKQEVIDWLNENIKDSTNKIRSDMPQGWMIYDPKRVYQTTSVSVFFLRKADAMAFKLRWT